MITIFLGPPGSGKGTQADQVAKFFNFKPLSTGDLLRAEINAKTQLGNEIKEIVNSGKLVEDDIVLKLIERNLKKNSNINGFILDGFPRTIIQAKKLTEYLEKLGKKIDCVIEFNVDKKLLVNRLINRYQCKSCGAPYNKLYKNPRVEGVCDICGSTEFTTRKDDKKDVILRRFEEYKDLTSPLLPYYNNLGILYKVSADQEVKKIFDEICNILKNVLT